MLVLYFYDIYHVIFNRDVKIYTDIAKIFLNIRVSIIEQY